MSKHDHDHDGYDDDGDDDDGYADDGDDGDDDDDRGLIAKFSIIVVGSS